MKRLQRGIVTCGLQEFFDHFLKGAPGPEWMEKGISYLQREKEKEKYRTADDDEPERYLGAKPAVRMRARG